MVDRIIYCELLIVLQAQLSLIFFISRSANWSADAHLCGSGYAFLSDKRASILNRILYQFHLSVSLIRLQPSGTYVVSKNTTMTRRNMLTCKFIFFP